MKFHNIYVFHVIYRQYHCFSVFLNWLLKYSTNIEDSHLSHSQPGVGYQESLVLWRQTSFTLGKISLIYEDSYNLSQQFCAFAYNVSVSYSYVPLQTQQHMVILIFLRKSDELSFRTFFKKHKYEQLNTLHSTCFSISIGCFIIFYINN